MKNETTNLKELKNGASFVWGKLVKIHEIFEYAIVECHPLAKSNPNSCTLDTIDMNALEYHPYINGEEISCAYNSYDEALAGCIAYKHEGINHNAENYFMKMLK